MPSRPHPSFTHTHTHTTNPTPILNTRCTVLDLSVLLPFHSALLPPNKSTQHFHTTLLFQFLLRCGGVKLMSDVSKALAHLENVQWQLIVQPSKIALTTLFSLSQAPN
jgi:hypothetical protein